MGRDLARKGEGWEETAVFCVLVQCQTLPGAVPVLTFAHPKNLSAKEETSIFANGEAEAQREKVICIWSLRCAGFVRPQSPWIRLCGLRLTLPQSWQRFPGPLPELFLLGAASRPCPEHCGEGTEGSRLAASYFSRGKL